MKTKIFPHISPSKPKDRNDLPQKNLPQLNLGQSDLSFSRFHLILGYYFQEMLPKSSFYRCLLFCSLLQPEVQWAHDMRTHFSPS